MENENESAFSRVPEVVWEPKADSGKRMRAFMKKIQNKYNLPTDKYWDIYQWSLDNKEAFWKEIWEDSKIIYSKPYSQVLDPTLQMHEFQDWFSGARLNFAENLLRFRDDHIALISAGEDKEPKQYTYADVYEEAKLYAAALRRQGVKKGDTVACFMSNREEAIFAMLAAVSLGAIWTGALPLMGSQAVLNRLTQVRPIILFTVDRFQNDKHEKDMLPKLKEISENLPSLMKIVIVPSKLESKSKDITHIKNSCFLEDFLSTGKNEDGSVNEMTFEQVPFTHPVFINYTSGTTGLPKAVVHSCGILLCVHRDYHMHSNTDRNSCWLSMSPVGWATWSVISEQLFFGLKICLFEGVPYYLSPTSVWDVIDEFKISHMIMLPSHLDELEKRGYTPLEHHNLSSLHMIAIGGSVAKPQNFAFLRKNVKGNAIFAVVYGCTELMGIVAMSDENLKVHTAEIPTPCLGTEILVLDESGKSVVGEIGELVFCGIMPNLPELWGDPDRSQLKRAYYDQFPGKFCAGDLASINSLTRGLIIYGRSDETLKQRGCRFGSSEIYNITGRFPEIRDSLVVAQYNKKRDERAVLFLKMGAGLQLGQDLILRIRQSIADELSLRHVPDVILEAKEIPYNINGKKVELIIKKIINKMPFNADSIVNQESLDYYKNLQLGEF